MKKALIVVSVFLATTALSGCSGTTNSSEPDLNEPDVVAQSPASDSSEKGSIDPLQTQSAPAPATADDEALKKLDLNERGNEPVSVGEPAVFEDLTNGAKFAEMTATNAQTDFKCTAKDAAKSVNGQFVALDLKVDADPNLAESGFPEMYISVHEFRAWDAEGKRIEDPVGNAEACISAEERIPTPVDPGETATGLIILDVPKGPGNASFSLGGYQGAYGWEWSW
ncbi:hypothetical protein ACTXIX_03950 [Glutamicibacter ardleyensis]|uniref:hypothetical protein n=1 Tax=Glutamicibacter ardleyensis TaxID=225894 RepID=UPI003FCFD2AE